MRILFSTILIILLSCNSNKKKSEITLTPAEEIRARQMGDSIVKDAYKNVAFDTSGYYTCPIQVISARLVKQEYSNYKDIRVTYKNVSKERVEAIRFRWYGENAFGEPADMGSGIIEGIGGGFSDDPLGPGRTRSSDWSILSRDARKVVLCYVTEVAYTDGSKWLLSDPNTHPNKNLPVISTN